LDGTAGGERFEDAATFVDIGKRDRDRGARHRARPEVLASEAMSWKPGPCRVACMMRSAMPGGMSVPGGASPYFDIDSIDEDASV